MTDDSAARWSTVPVLQGRHVAIEPLRMAHASGLAEAASDGRLWELWYTNVPGPGDMEAYVAKALAEPAQMAFVVRDALLPLLWIGGWVGRGFVWRGNQVRAVESRGAI